MRLFEPITIRGMTIKNRIIMSSMGVGFGYTNKRVVDFYVERARGGVGAIIIGAGIPDLFMNDAAWGKQGGAAVFINRLQTLTSEVNKAGARIGIQFIYGNRYPLGLDLTSGELAAPSARIEADPSSHAFVKPGESLRELTLQEISSIIDKIARAAAGAKEAGFDFVELHNGHGMLPCQFFSPTTNYRTDRYGGDATRRMTFGIETVRAMRDAVGTGYPLFVRHGVVDAVPNGATLEEGVAFAVELEKAGADVFNVTLATPPICGGYVPTGEDPVATHVHLAEAVKRQVTVPVIGVGRIKSPEVAEAALAGGKIDMVAIGRQMFADPYWPQKVMAGHVESIVPCIDCHECYERATAGSGLECTVNYRAGRERESRLSGAEKKKRVMVIGGGPAGMEAARVAAIRGHSVTLADRGNQLGGAMLLQAIVPSKGEVENLTKYLTSEIDRQQVNVRLRQVDVPEADQHDAVIVATGASPLIPAIPGIDGENVISSGNLRSLFSGGGEEGITIRSGWRGAMIKMGSVLLNRPLQLALRKSCARFGTPLIFGKSVVIIGGNMTACQLADLLAENGRRVTVVAQEDDIALDMVSTLRFRLMRRLSDRQVTVIKGIRSYESLEGDRLVIINGTGNRQAVNGDTFIPMLGLRQNDAMVEKLKRLVPEVFVAGDSAEPLKLLHAVHDGARIGREV